MNDNPYKAPESVLELAIDEDVTQFYVVSIKKFTILFFLTLGIYTVYWFYRNWKEYKIYNGSNIWPVPRAIFAIFFTHSLFSAVQDAMKNKEKTYNWSPNLLATTYVILAVISHILDRMSMNEIGSPVTDLLSIFVLVLLYIPLARAQRAINVSQGDPEGDTNKVFTGANYAWIIIGTLFWLMALLGFLAMFGLVDIQ